LKVEKKGKQVKWNERQRGNWKYWKQHRKRKKIGRSEVKKNRARWKLLLPMSSALTSSSTACGDVERYSRMIRGSSAEAVWKGGTRIFPVGNEVVATCVAVADVNACALLHSTLGTLVRPGVQSVLFAIFFLKHYYK
jgi:hypothetical protein